MQSQETNKLFIAMLVGFGVILVFFFWAALSESANRDYLGYNPVSIVETYS